MPAHVPRGPGRSPARLVPLFWRLLLLGTPAVLMALLGLRMPEQLQLSMWAGAAAVAGVGLILGWLNRGWDDIGGPGVILLYVIALSWILIIAPGRRDGVLHLTQAVFLMVPLTFFARQCLRDSGATTMRRARQLASGLAARRDWPEELLECRALPEVKALRESLLIDASPALELLAHPSPAVRVAALGAMEYRSHWRAGQPQLVLQAAHRAPEPEVRAAAVLALANLDERLVVESLAELLRDPSRLVRDMTTEAVLWNCERRWPWIRDAVRHALGDATYQDDGPLKLSGIQLSAEAVDDFYAWAAEKGTISIRAALTLGAHYGHLLNAGMPDDELEALRARLTNPATPAVLRLELAHLLNHYRELDVADLRNMLNPTMPAPVRLIAVEAMLALGPSPEAVAALHDLARLPNREIALATAELVQRRLGVDLGLPPGQPLPPIHTRTAAEVARRLMAWATQHEVVESPAPAHEMRQRYRGDEY